MKTQKEKFDAMQLMYDNASPPEFEAREEAFALEVERLKNEISSNADQLYFAVLKFLALSCKEGWPKEYTNLYGAFDSLIDFATQNPEKNTPFNSICDAAANWEAKRLTAEVFKDK